MQLAGMLCWGDAALPYALLCMIRQFPWQRLCVRGIATYRVVLDTDPYEMCTAMLPPAPQQQSCFSLDSLHSRL